MTEGPLTVGWIGLGEMGLPMAANLRRSGIAVIAFDIAASRLAAATAAGIVPASSARAVADEADVVVAMLRTTAQVEELLGGADGLAAAVPASAVLDVIVMSTLDPEAMERLAARTAGRLRIVDAPVSGGVRGAEDASLAIMASGPAEALARVEAAVRRARRRVFEVGDRPGLGQAVKLANQVMMAAALAGTTEALTLSRSYGLEDEAVCAAVCAGTGASWVLEHWPWMSSLWERYEPGNSLDILVKDIRGTLAQAEVGASSCP